MIVKEQDYLEWHGRAGMKWYQHIFGRAQSGAKYFSKLGSAKKAAKQLKEEKKRIDRENRTIRDRIVNPRGKNGKAAKVETLSNAELKAAVDRINAEKNYMQAVNNLNKEKRDAAQAKIDTAKQYYQVAKDIYKLYDNYKTDQEKAKKEAADAKRRKESPIGEAVRDAAKDWQAGVNQAKADRNQQKQEKKKKKK